MTPGQNDQTPRPPAPSNTPGGSSGTLRPMTEHTLTWDTLAAIEPKLVHLEDLTRWIANHVRDDEKRWCANTMWYDQLKPQLRPLVGWGRGYPITGQAEPPADRPRAYTLREFMDKYGKDRVRTPAETAEEELLRTEAAYDLAYDHLYALLPDCRECLCAPAPPR